MLTSAGHNPDLFCYSIDAIEGFHAGWRADPLDGLFVRGDGPTVYRNPQDTFEVVVPDEIGPDVRSLCVDAPFEVAVEALRAWSLS